MSKYELTISSDYCKNWTVFHAIRELFQNSVDEEVQNPKNKSFFSYDEDSETLTIGNKSSVLDIKTLLLGVTSKTGDDNTIGQFGEGYKIATLILLRTGHNVTFYNYGNREVWTTKLVKSRRFGGEYVPTFYVDKKYVWQSVPDNNLTITISNITKSEYEEITDKILMLHSNTGEVLSTYYGDILLDKQYKGKVFVSGLYVCDNERLNFGYNVKPSFLKLDRDRQSVADFDILWRSSAMWAEHTDHEAFKQVFYGDNNDDMLYLKSMTSFDSLSDSLKSEFFIRYGKDAIPVRTQEEFNRIRELGGKPVIVTDTVASVFKNIYDDFIATSTVRKSCYQFLDEWMQSLKSEVDIPHYHEQKFYDILTEFEDILKG